MNEVTQAIADGRCALAVSGSLLRDPDVMLALKNRAALVPMALAGPAVAPVIPIGEAGVARVMSQKNGLVVVVEPETADSKGLASLGKLLQRAPHKPKIVVVARNYNPFAFGGALRGLSVAHEKGRGKKFIQTLPHPPAIDQLPEVAAVPKAKKAKSEIPAPRFVFAGREEELETLAGHLAEGGPLVVSGPMGIGKAWLVEHALAASELNRLPDFVLGYGSEFDTLIARLAVICREAGAPQLSDALKDQERTPVKLVDAAIEALSAADLGGRVMVLRHLQHSAGREGDFFRKSRVEMLLEALLTNTYSLRLIFLSTLQPRFYREGQGAALRRMELGGLKGRFLHEIFAAYKCPEFPRDKFGPLSDRINGHPLAARACAVAVREQPDGLKLLDEPKFLAQKEPGDLERLNKHLEKMVSKISKRLRAVLGAVAHMRLPVDGTILATLEIPRKMRLELLASGALDMIGTETERKYQVHALIRRKLSFREVVDFEVFSTLVEVYGKMSSNAEDPIEKLAWLQEANRCAVAGRKFKSVRSTEFPDQDPLLESAVGLMRGKQPRLDMAETRLREASNRDPANADAYILAVELQHRQEVPGESMAQLFEAAIAKAPVPELFQQAANFWTGARRSRVTAIPLLETGVEQLPNEPRIRTRLASLLFPQGRRPEAIEHLTKAMELAPMLPDAYGLMGQARRQEGQVEEAEGLLREAVRLAPEDVVQLTRLVDLLMARARVDIDNQKTLREEARELLDVAMKDTRKSSAQVLLATLLREEGEDIERAGWLLGKAKPHLNRKGDLYKRLQIEKALQLMANGDLDLAEATIRERCQLDPTDHRAFVALGHILEARELFVPAHAEYLRAKERSAQNSLEAQAYEAHMKRMQAVIEAQAAGLWVSAASPPAPEPTPTSENPTGYQRVIRRRKAAPDGEGTDEAQAEDEAPAEPQAEDEAPAEAQAEEEAPVEPSVEPHAEDAEPQADDAEPQAEDAEPQPEGEAPVEPSGESQAEEDAPVEPSIETEVEVEAVDQDPTPAAEE